MGGEACVAGGMHGRGVHGRSGVHGRRACMAGEHAWQGVCVEGETAIAAGGTHPTGMYSCLGYYLLVLCACSKSSIIRNICTY